MGYEFITLDDAQKQARRESLDRHAAIAQFSAAVPIAVILLYRLGSWLATRSSSQRGAYAAVPGSPVLKQKRLSAAGSWTSTFRAIGWWFGDDVVFLGQNWGQRDQMIAGAGWFLWLVFLCFNDTGNDYLHLTKRFGIVALSQFPLQFLLSLKNINPFAYAFGSSHEHLNRWHRTLGWVIYFLLCAHASLYLNFYVQQGILAERLTKLVPVLGLSSFIGITLMSVTALKFIRDYSYRVFFIIHLIGALSLLGAIYFHSHHSGRQYVIEPLVFFGVDFLKRKIETLSFPSTVELIPGTSLIKIVSSLPSKNVNRFRKYNGMHVYLTIPPGSRRSSFLIFEFAYNPFTIASVEEESGDLVLVARRQSGPMTGALAQFADEKPTDTKVSLCMEGPYGSAARFPNLAGPEFDRVLLVAGGVGSTFILPLYRLIMSENPAARVQLVWAVRAAGDATWADPAILDDDNVHLYITGDADTSGGEMTLREAVELTDNSHTNPRQIRKRPDLRKIVDDFFKQGIEDRVAVLVCGPDTMARELRTHVGAWARKGRDIWWHNEGFTW